MKKITTFAILFGFLTVTLGVSAASPQYPSAPLPPYAEQELQKVIDGSSGPSSSVAPVADKRAVTPKAAAEESHAAASVSKRLGRSTTSPRRHARHTLV